MWVCAVYNGISGKGREMGRENDAVLDGWELDCSAGEKIGYDHYHDYKYPNEDVLEHNLFSHS